MKARAKLRIGVALAFSVAVSCGRSGEIREKGGHDASVRGAAAPAPAPAPAGSGKWVTVAYVGYQKDLYPPEAIAWGELTHLSIGRTVPRKDGSLDTTFDIDPVNGPVLGKKLAELAHENGKKAVMMLGGAGTHEGWVGAASAENRARFVGNLVKLAADYGVDGFDLDWEPIEKADQPSFEALAKALRAALPGAILTVPLLYTSVHSPRGDAFYGRVAPLFDQVNLMTFSMAGAWQGWQSWHSSALHGASPSTPTSVDTTVEFYLASGVPPEKLGVGIGFFGACWSAPVNKPRMSLGRSQVVAEDNIMSFTNIMDRYFVPESRRWDETAKTPYLSFDAPHGPKGCTLVTYEDEQSIREKTRYVKERGLGGVIVWTINQGYRPALPEGKRDPLMAAIAEGLLR